MKKEERRKQELEFAEGFQRINNLTLQFVITPAMYGAINPDK